MVEIRSDRPTRICSIESYGVKDVDVLFLVLLYVEGPDDIFVLLGLVYFLSHTDRVPLVRHLQPTKIINPSKKIGLLIKSLSLYVQETLFSDVSTLSETISPYFFLLYGPLFTVTVPCRLWTF